MFTDGRFKCFGCGVGDDVIGFVMRVEGASFLDAKRITAALAGVTLSRVDSATVRRLAAARRRAQAAAAELIGWRNSLIMALRDARSIAWTDANQIDRITAGADPEDPQTWLLAAEEVRRRRAGDTIDNYADTVFLMTAAELQALRWRLEGDGLARVA